LFNGTSQEEASLLASTKRGIFTISLAGALWAALLLWACFETLSLYRWTRPNPGESSSHLKGRMEALSPLSRLVASGLFIGAAGVAALTLALIYSNRLKSLQEEAAKQKGRRLEAEEMGLAAAGLAHETKNPLGLMRGMAQRIAGGSLPEEEAKELAGRIVEEADRTSSRLGEFLRYAGMRAPLMRRISAKDAVEKVAVLLEDEFREAKVELARLVDPIAIEADEEMLSQILVNLLLNALKSTPEGGRVVACIARKTRQLAELSVSDDGRGIPAEVLPNIFKPYYTRRSGGCGSAWPS
jgi:signal transduction histidine kinase